MKDSIFIIIFFFTCFTYSQSKGKFLINKDVEITHITFEKSLKNLYSKSKEKKLIKLEFSLRKKRKSIENECFLIRHYNDDIDIKNIKNLKEIKEEVEVEYFYELVEKLNHINSDKLRENFNITDGITCNINFSGENYNISFSDNSEDESKSDFYNLFKSVWIKFYQ